VSPSCRTQLTLIFGLLAWSGCELTSHDLDAFQTTATGPTKIRAVLEDGSRDPELRTRAAMLLLDLDRRDLHGPDELQRELTSLGDDSLARLALPLSRALLARMQTEPGKVPGRGAVRAKDAAERALELLAPEQRRILGEMLIRWIVADVAKRADTGKSSLEALSGKLGANAAPPLLHGLRSDVPLPDLVRLSVLLDRHATPALRAETASRLLDISAHLHTPQGLLPALGHFAEQPGVRQRLVATARDKARSVEDRAEALTLLEGHATAAELLPLLGLALDEREEVTLRELAVTRAGETGSSEALPGLLMLVGDRRHERLRTLAGQQVLDLGGPKMLASFFRALPRGWDTPYTRREIDAYSKHLNRFTPDMALLMLLGDKLHSSAWWPRVLALRYFAAQGSFEDLWRIRKHESDTAPILGEGWPRGHTVGQEATVCVNALNERLLRTR